MYTYCMYSTDTVQITGFVLYMRRVRIPQQIRTSKGGLFGDKSKVACIYSLNTGENKGYPTGGKNLHNRERR